MKVYDTYERYGSVRNPLDPDGPYIEFEDHAIVCDDEELYDALLAEYGRFLEPADGGAEAQDDEDESDQDEPELDDDEEEADDEEAESDVCGVVKADGEPCQRPAGWGVEGDEGPCKFHVELEEDA